MAKKIEELRESEFHQELGQKMCAAFIAQQQGIALNTALKKTRCLLAICGCCWLSSRDGALLKTQTVRFSASSRRRRPSSSCRVAEIGQDVNFYDRKEKLAQSVTDTRCRGLLYVQPVVTTTGSNHDSDEDEHGN